MHIPNIIQFDPQPRHASLRRPKLLIRAAREGQAGWRRDRDLKRLLKCDETPAPGRAIRRLRFVEGQMNDARIEKAAHYDLQHHIRLLIAILAEMRAVVAAAPTPVTLS